ncbi:SRPN19 [Trypoxylus dichotomus]
MLCYGDDFSGEYHYHRAFPQDVMVDVINNFGFALLEAHNEGNENNIALSPYGATSVLVALGEGIRGYAVKEIREATHIPLDISVVRIGLRDIHRHLKSYFIPKEGFLAGLTLSNEKVPLVPRYEEILRFYGYDSESFNNPLYPDMFTTTPAVEMMDNNATTSTVSLNKITTEAADIAATTETRESRIEATESVVPSTVNKIDDTTLVLTSTLSAESITNSIENSTNTTTILNEPQSTPFATNAVETSTSNSALHQFLTTIKYENTSDSNTMLNEAQSATTGIITTIPNSTSIQIVTTLKYENDSDSNTSGSNLMENILATVDYESTTIPIITNTTVPVSQDAEQVISTENLIQQVFTMTSTFTELTTPATKSEDALETADMLENNTMVVATTSMKPILSVTTLANDITVVDTVTAENMLTSTPLAIGTISDSSENIQASTTDMKLETLSTIVNTKIEELTSSITTNIDISQSTTESMSTLSTTSSHDESSTVLKDNTLAEELTIPANLTTTSVPVALTSTDSLINEEISTQEFTTSDIITSENLSTLVTTTAIPEMSMKNATKVNQTEDTKRDARSVIDYIIARYYDNFPHRRYFYDRSYKPEEELAFLVYGKYRETNINFMTYDAVLPIAYVPIINALALSFPLDSKEYYLLLLLPIDDNDIDKLIYGLNRKTSLRSIINSLRYAHVKAIIPSFMLKGYVVLTPTLQKLGIRRIFEPRHTDFSLMTKEKDIYVTNIEQAVTVTIRNYVDPENIPNYRNLQQFRPIEFKADRPFLYFVMDTDIHVNLMSGKIVNPLNSRIR